MGFLITIFAIVLAAFLAILITGVSDFRRLTKPARSRFFQILFSRAFFKWLFSIIFCKHEHTRTIGVRYLQCKHCGSVRPVKPMDEDDQEDIFLFR